MKAVFVVIFAAVLLETAMCEGPSSDGNQEPRAGKPEPISIPPQATPATIAESRSGLVQVFVSEPREPVIVTDAIPIYVTIANMREQTISIVDVRLNVPPMLAATRNPVDLAGILAVAAPVTAPLDAHAEKRLWQWEGKDSNAKDLVRGAKGQYPIILQSTNQAGANLWSNLRLLMFRPADYEIGVIVEHTLPGSEVDTTVIESKIRIRFLPSPASILIGALVGSIALAFFQLSYVIVHNGLKNGLAIELGAGPSHLTWKTLATRILWLLGKIAGKITLGTLAAGIFVVFTYFQKEAPMPINIVVSDFFGGALLGFWSPKLASWLWRLQSEKGNARIPKPTPKKTKSS